MNLFDKQRKLDEMIIEEHGLGGEFLVEKKLIAFKVELAELCQELPCYWKFWKRKVIIDKDRVIDEYVDGLHFIISLGNDGGFSGLELPDIYEEILNDMSGSDLSIVDLFNYLFCFNLREMMFIDLLKMYFVLGRKIGFDWDDIEEGYNKKYEINVNRQINHY